MLYKDEKAKLFMLERKVKAFKIKTYPHGGRDVE